MKKIALILSAALITIIVFAFDGGEEYETIKIGSKAPMMDYQMSSTQGEKMVIGEMSQGNGLLVIFSCNTCPFVIAWEDRYPDIANWAKEAKVGLALVNSNAAKREGDDSMEAMKQHAEEHGYPEIPYLVDQNSNLANAFGAKTTPHVFLFDKEMKLVYEGAIDDNHKSQEAVKVTYLKDALMNLNEGKEIDPNNTKSIGCSIKRAKS